MTISSTRRGLRVYYDFPIYLFCTNKKIWTKSFPPPITIIKLKYFSKHSGNPPKYRLTISARQLLYIQLKKMSGIIVFQPTNIKELMVSCGFGSRRTTIEIPICGWITIKRIYLLIHWSLLIHKTATADDIYIHTYMISLQDWQHYKVKSSAKKRKPMIINLRILHCWLLSTILPAEMVARQWFLY